MANPQSSAGNNGRRMMAFLTAAFILFFSLVPAAGTYAAAGQPQGAAEDRTPSLNSRFSGFPYVLDSYDVDITVNDDNTFSITEKITAFFNVERHGIIRNIPVQNTVRRADGSTSENHAAVKNIKVQQDGQPADVKTTYGSGNCAVKIGSSGSMLKKSHTYTIGYTYDIGADRLKNADEFYFNVIGDDWDTCIGNITFRIRMPKEFDHSQIGFSTGRTGSVGYDRTVLDYTVSENEITGAYNGILFPYEGLTARIELPEGYFVRKRISDLPAILLLILVPLISLLVIFILWFRYGKDRRVTETVEFYPPEHMNSLDIACAYKGRANEKDVMSLLIYLASKGYLRIEEEDEKGILFKTRPFTVTKLKEYDGTDRNEKLFFDGLFACAGPKADRVSSEKLEYRFIKVIRQILRNTGSDGRLFEKQSSSVNLLIVGLIILSMAVPVALMARYVPEAFAIVGPFIMITAGTLFFLVGKNGQNKTAQFVMSIFMVMWFIPVLIVFIKGLIMIFEDDPVYAAAFLFAAVCIVLMAVLKELMPRRTEYGAAVLGKLRGFRTFLRDAEKNQLETLAAGNPSYFYDILPFAYVLGVTDVWIKKFEGIISEAPSWYRSRDSFTNYSFDRIMNTAVSSGTVDHSSSGGGGGSGSSGGGSSGGGSGGGGGSSW
jgi:hypothetical protein